MLFVRGYGYPVPTKIQVMNSALLFCYDSLLLNFVSYCLCSVRSLRRYW